VPINGTVIGELTTEGVTPVRLALERSRSRARTSEPADRAAAL